MKVGEEKKREREQKRGGAAGALERTPFFHGGLRLRMALLVSIRGLLDERWAPRLISDASPTVSGPTSRHSSQGIII